MGVQSNVLRGASVGDTNRIKVEVNKMACCAYGLCAEICPQVYKLDDNGIAYTDDGLVPKELEELAREGAAACPQLAISVLEVSE
jgi:ferredoxin